ncbi:MAG: hybrid sensor histidine kinase/response regulator [Desulfomonilaceae bacterium]
MAVIVIVGILWDAVSHVRLIVWGLVYVIFSIALLFLVRAFRKSNPADENLPLWEKRHSEMTLLGGLLWLAAVIFLFPRDHEHLQILLVLFLGGRVTYTTVIYAPTREYLINIIVLLVPLSCQFFYQGSNFDILIGVVLLMYNLLMVFFGRGVHNLYLEIFKLRFEKDDLVQSLREGIALRDKILATTQRLRVEAEIATAAKNEFLMNMSHELRTPLTAIIGFSELLAARFYGDLNEKQMNYVQEIFDSGQQLLKLINDILDLSKIEIGREDLEIAPIDLDQLLRHCMAMIKEKAARRNLKLELQIDDSVRVYGNINADELKLKQIVVNLLSNATKFSPSGGRIRVEAWSDDDNLMISVSDTGIGIRSEDQLRIYDAFERLNSAYSRPESGTGLGLALARKLAELHGGRIWVESEGEGKGSTFKFVIPLKQPLEKQHQEYDPFKELKALSPDPGVNNSKPFEQRPIVLVVQDNDTDVKLMTDLLETGGYKRLVAFSVEEGVKMALKENPDLILMDISLPKIDGVKATRALKKDPSTAQIPVVALIAHSMEDDQEKLMNTGFDGYILKPIDIKNFYLTVSRFTQSGKAMDSLPPE